MRGSTTRQVTMLALVDPDQLRRHADGVARFEQTSERIAEQGQTGNQDLAPCRVGPQAGPVGCCLVLSAGSPDGRWRRRASSA